MELVFRERRGEFHLEGELIEQPLHPLHLGTRWVVLIGASR